MLTYQKREAAIPFDSKTRLIGLPILFSILLMFFVPLLVMGMIAGVSFLINTTLGTDFPLIRAEQVSFMGAIQMILMIVISTFIIVKISEIKIADLGLSVVNAFSKILIGTVGGFVAISAVALLVNLIGGVDTVFVFKPEYIGMLLVGLVYFSFQGTYEELIFRGYLLPHFSKKMGIVGAVILSSALFALIHAFNPGMTVMPIVNLFLAGVVFAVVYYYTGNLLIVGFAHAIWNYSQGFIYGSNVSGIKLTETIFKSAPTTDNIFLSGGIFGFEGSIATTIVGLAITVLFIVLIQKKK